MDFKWRASIPGRTVRQDTEKADAGALLLRAEREAEKTSAVVRLIVFLALTSVQFYAISTANASSGSLFVVGVYGIGTAAGLFLAWRGVFHPAIPYFFVTLDVLVVAIQVLLLSRVMGMQSAAPFALPAAALIFVILIYAALRYRPWLVIYAALLFVVAIELGSLVFTVDQPGGMSGMHSMRSMPHVGMMDIVNFQVVPLMTIALATFVLFVMGRRTRALLFDSIRFGTEVARLSRYFSPNVARRLAEDDTERALQGRRQPAAVLFVDIRNFTAIGETMAPNDLGALLADYRQRLTEPVFARGGTVDKFIGDAIMIVFGSPLQGPDDASNALGCALEILEAATRWSEERIAAGYPPVAVGIGGHYGEVFAGALGSGRLLEFTVIGDTVNVAERLERLSRDVDSPLVVSAALLDAAGEWGEQPKWRYLEPQLLKGHKKPVDAYGIASITET